MASLSYTIELNNVTKYLVRDVPQRKSISASKNLQLKSLRRFKILYNDTLKLSYHRGGGTELKVS